MSPEEAYKTLPPRVKIGAHTYRVCVVDSLDDATFAEWDLDALTLSLRKDMCSASHIASALWHECLHAIWFDRNLGKKADEETVILAFENGGIQLIQDNPKLFVWIRKCLLAKR